MSTSAQIAANQANAQHSTGPRTEEGKAASSHNNFRYGFTGAFLILPWEKQEEFESLLTGLREEHQPRTTTEAALVDKMAQSLWLANRAALLQHLAFNPEVPACDNEKQLALYLRYQTTHDRAFHRSLNQLLKLRSETRKAEIGFESQGRRNQQLLRRAADEKRKQATESRRVSAESRKQELHRFAVLLAEAKLDHQMLQNHTLETAHILASHTSEDRLETRHAA